MKIRVYLRRSKNDEGKQQFSLDVQRDGARRFVSHLELADRETVEYVDDGRAGDDFHTRTGLQRLIADAAAGDIIVARDQSRLGRDAIEVTLVIRDLVRDRGCRLFYYVSGQEVQFANAIDAATTFIQGTGHQMELEAIRSRTREALRSRVREGRVAGGACFGYSLERRQDGSGRGYTLAIVNDEEAAVVRRIYEMYRSNHGLKAIAKRLNHEGVPSPSAGRRGSGSWAPSSIRSILMNPRYRGVYIHGRIKKVRRGGSSVRVKADPHEILEVEVPEWRIVDDALWFAVQERFGTRAQRKRRSSKAAKYPLTGIARCSKCGGSIGCGRTKQRGKVVKAYGCTFHRERGNAVCDVSVLQPMGEVEDALVHHLQENLLTDEIATETLKQIELETRAQMPSPTVDAESLKAELAQVEKERTKLAKAVALADDVPELVAELNRRSARIRHLGEQLATALLGPEQMAAKIREIEARAKSDLANLREGLSERKHLREVFLSLFPDGLEFSPEWVQAETGRRRVWRIRGLPRLGAFPITLRPQRDSNPCRRRERPVS